MAFNPNIAYLIILSFLLSVATTTIIKNTIHYDVISDADRYIQGITNGTTNSLGVRLLAPLISESTDDFVTKTNFLFIFLIGYLIFTSTNSWRITILALLGFSVSLLTYFSLLAQAIVIIIGLWLWTKVEPKGIKNNLFYLIAGTFAYFTHKFGAPLVILIYIIKRMEVENSIFPVWSKRLALLGYGVVGILILFVFFPSPERVSFFYFFLLPISLGPFDMIFWIGLFGVILWMLLKCENNTKELLIVSACLFAIIINYLFVSQLEIDCWRLIVFAELVALIKIGQSNQNGDLLKWAPWFLIAMGVERLILGLLV
jgi:hypothetical protein